MKKLVLLGGSLSLVFLAFHIAFWHLFDWPASLGYMTAEHRMVMQTFNFCMLPFFVVSAYALLALPDEVLGTRVGRTLLVMNALLYAMRAIAEPLFGDLSQPTARFLLALCLLVSALFAAPALAAGKRPAPDGGSGVGG